MNNSSIPFFGLPRQYQDLREEILSVTDDVYTSGQVLDGKCTEAFEYAMGQRCNRQYAVAVNSCTQGLIFAMMAGVDCGGKVLIPNISFVATVNSVILSGHDPMLCDTDAKALINLESVDFALHGAGVRAIMYPNLFGNCIDYDRFRIQTEFFNDSLFIIEDAAQSFGASYKGIPSGKMGDVSVLSFDPTKNLPNYGSGGMVLTDDYNLYSTILDLRDNGKNDAHNTAGTNSKMSESDCAQMLVKLTHFDAWQRRRTKIANYYIDNLKDLVDIIMPNEHVVHAWHKFVMLCPSRYSMKEYLISRGVETKFHYTAPLSELPVSSEYLNYNSYDFFKESDAFSKECISLPIYPELTDYEVEYIVECIQKFFS